VKGKEDERKLPRVTKKVDLISNHYQRWAGLPVNVPNSGGCGKTGKWTRKQTWKD